MTDSVHKKGGEIPTPRTDALVEEFRGSNGPRESRLRAMNIQAVDLARQLEAALADEIRAVSALQGAVVEQTVRADDAERALSAATARADKAYPYPDAEPWTVEELAEQYDAKKTQLSEALRLADMYSRELVVESNANKAWEAEFKGQAKALLQGSEPVGLGPIMEPGCQDPTYSPDRVSSDPDYFRRPDLPPPEIRHSVAHNGHPERHYDRTCPACNPEPPCLGPSRERRQKIASEVIEKHGMHLVYALRRPDGDGYGGMNLVALMELFAERLATEPPRQGNGQPSGPGYLDLTEPDPRIVPADESEGEEAMRHARLRMKP